MARAGTARKNLVSAAEPNFFPGIWSGRRFSFPIPVRPKSPGQIFPRLRPCGARGSRESGRCSRTEARLALLLLGIALLAGCDKKPSAPASAPVSARVLFEQAVRDFHTPSAEANGAERARLLAGAAERYERLLKEFPAERDLGAQALRGLGSIRASQGKLDEAVELYATVGKKFPEHDWQVVQAWKAAADLLWATNRREEAKQFYAQIVARFGKNDAPQIISTVVRGSKARLAE